MGLHAFKLLDEVYSEYEKDGTFGRQLPLGTYFSILDRSGEQPLQASYSTALFNEVIREQQGKTDRYFSQCFFNERNRKGVHCESISHLWVDLDFYKSPVSKLRTH